MDKFGLFDLLSKLSTTENKNNPILKLLDSFSFTTSKKPSQNLSTKKGGVNHLKATPQYKSDAILKIIENHDKLSKQIDKNNNK